MMTRAQHYMMLYAKHYQLKRLQDLAVKVPGVWRDKAPAGDRMAEEAHEMRELKRALGGSGKRELKALMLEWSGGKFDGYEMQVDKAGKP
jgi:hypothetical protein